MRTGLLIHNLLPSTIYFSLSIVDCLVAPHSAVSALLGLTYIAIGDRFPPDLSITLLLSICSKQHISPST